MNKEKRTVLNNASKHLVMFKGKDIRRTEHNGEWYFCIVDIVAVLTDSLDPSGYIKDMRRRDKELSQGWGQIATPLSLETAGGKQKLNCANVEGIFRIIQSIPSPKAEPFKKWLARVGYERLQEIENPELTQKRMKALYEAKGYPKEWIDKRMRGIAVRDALTDEWKARGIEEDRDFAILTAEISKATFGLTPSEYKDLKGLKRENLRDHMSDLELIFTMLGEASTTEIAQKTDARGFNQNKTAARKGGKIAGNARKQLESETGRHVISSNNFLQLERDEEENT